MKNVITHTVRSAALVAALLTVTAFASAKDTPADRAAELLAHHGSVAVTHAGPYVEVGTYQIQVSVKLGQPSARLADGSWLYRNYAVDDSNASGLLVVRFASGRVAGLSLVTPTVATALLRTPRKDADKVVVAAAQQ